MTTTTNKVKSIYEQNLEYAMWYFNTIYHTNLKTIKETEEFMKLNGMKLS